MTTAREQQQSKTFRHGEGKDHEAAKTRLVKVLMDANWTVDPDAKLEVECRFSTQSGFLLNHIKYKHELDIFAHKEFDNNLVSEKAFEIDGSSHEKKKQQNRDDDAKRYANFFLPNCNLYRVPISELIGPHRLTDAELWILYKLR